MKEAKKESLAKNTAVLYVRMLVQMLIYLYTSRVIAQVLGMVDWGIYDVVGGIVLVMSFLNNSMTVCSQRYLTYAIGYGDRTYLNRVYSVAVLIHVAIAVILVVLGETVGLWYLSNNVVVPAGRFDAALMVYHCSLMSAAFMISTVPFNALVIAYEKMTAFAIISIADVVLKLIIILALSDATIDRLKMYSFMLLVEMILVRLAYVIYCRKKFGLTLGIPEIRKKQSLHSDSELKSDRVLFFNMLKFSGWSVFGNLSVVCNTQGINLLLNFVGGPILNAARVIAFNVQTAIMAFVSSFQTAMNPRITKYYASGDVPMMNQLVFASSRVSYMLIYVVALPLLIETPFILRLWLGDDLPEYAVLFTRLLIVVSIIDAVANPLTIAVSATGNIKRYHIIIGGILLMVLPVAAISVIGNNQPATVFVIQIVFVCIAQVARMFMCRRLFDFNIKLYMKNVGMRIFLVTITGTIVPCVMYFMMDKTLLCSVLVMLVSLVSAMSAVFALGLRAEERQFVMKKIMKR